MKSGLILFFLGCSLFFSPKKMSDTFEERLEEIGRNFRNGIFDKEECKKQNHEADDLVEEIKDAINATNSQEEVSKLYPLLKNAEALEEYIGVVGGVANRFPKFVELKLANEYVGGAISYFSKDKLCVDVITIKIDNYIAYLVLNNSITNNTVNYSWKNSSGTSKGNGTLGLSSKAVRHIYDNRENPSQKNIVVYGVSCKPF